MNHHGQQQPQRVDDDVPLAPFDRLASILASLSAHQRRLHTLRVDDGCRGAGIAPFFQADFLPQGIVQLLPDTQPLKLTEVVRGRPRDRLSSTVVGR